MSQFHAEALSHGAPPVEALPRLMGWTADAAAADGAPEAPPEPAPSDAADHTEDEAVVEVVDEEDPQIVEEAPAEDFDSALDDVLSDD